MLILSKCIHCRRQAVAECLRCGDRLCGACGKAHIEAERRLIGIESVLMQLCGQCFKPADYMCLCCEKLTCLGCGSTEG